VSAILIMLRSEVRFLLALRKSLVRVVSGPADWSEERSTEEC
jgi:hypothetical protein